jgi:signal transduction histidine kinase
VSPLSGTGGAASPPKGKRPLHIWLEAGIEEPLEKTSAFAKILFDEHQEALSEEGRICLTKLIKNARSARERLRALIDYLRTSQLSCRTETLPARPLLDRVLEELDEQIREGQVKLTVDRSLPEVLGDPDLIRIALHEILGNAVKFNNKDERLVSVKGIVEGNRALLMIADNGIGIDVGEEAAIFEPFTRGLRAGLYEGAGLGLARARSCAERMGGSIRVESVAGEGTTFILDLAAPPTPATSTELPDVNFRYARPGARFS